MRKASQPVHSTAAITSTSAGEQCTLVKNTIPEPCQLSAGDWLRHAPRGAYTTARTVYGKNVFELDFHLERLKTSAQMMIEADNQARQGKQTMLQPDDLPQKVLSSLRAGVTAFNKGYPDFQGELKLTVLVTWEDSGFDVLTHVSTLPPRPARPVKVQVLGAPRMNAAAKDSEWVRERQALEARKPPDVNEILLADADGAVLEGMSSNFFAVIGGAVHTAEEGVLKGTVREVVLQVCAQEGIPVVLEAPRLAGLQDWEGALISSTSRLLLPIDVLEVPGGEGKKAPVERKAFPAGGLAGKLERLLLAQVAASSQSLF